MNNEELMEHWKPQFLMDLKVDKTIVVFGWRTEWKISANAKAWGKHASNKGDENEDDEWELTEGFFT